MSRSLGLLISLFALILLLLSLFVFWIFTSGQINFAKGVDPFAECRMSKALGNSNIGGEFELINQDGQIVTDKDIFKEPTILYFGYTFCPDICPLDVYRNAEAVDLLDKNEMSVTPVFVSIDPERDTPEVIGDFGYLVNPLNIKSIASAINAVINDKKCFEKALQEGPSRAESFNWLDTARTIEKIIQEID